MEGKRELVCTLGEAAPAHQVQQLFVWLIKEALETLRYESPFIRLMYETIRAVYLNHVVTFILPLLDMLSTVFCTVPCHYQYRDTGNRQYCYQNVYIYIYLMSSNRNKWEVQLFFFSARNPGRESFRYSQEGFVKFR